MAELGPAAIGITRIGGPPAITALNDLQLGSFTAPPCLGGLDPGCLVFSTSSTEAGTFTDPQIYLATTIPSAAVTASVMMSRLIPTSQRSLRYRRKRSGTTMSRI
jgi:hypothetical protein